MADKSNYLYWFGKFKDDFKTDYENVEDTFSARFQLLWNTVNNQFALEWDEWPPKEDTTDNDDNKENEEKERESGEEDSDSDSDDGNGFVRWQPEHYSSQFCGDAVIFEQHLGDDPNKPTEKFFIVGVWGRGSEENHQSAPGRLFYKALPVDLPEGMEHLRATQFTEFNSLFSELEDYCHKEYTEAEWNSDNIQPRYVNIRFSCKA